MVNRSTVVDTVDEAAGHDTNLGVTSWSAQAKAVGGTASGWETSVVEIRARSVNPLAYWGTVKAAVAAGTQRGRIVCVGDSITACYGTSGTVTQNSIKYSYPTVLASIMTSAPARATSFLGAHNSATANVPYNQYDNRVVLGSGWYADTEGGTAGAQFFVSSAANSSLAFTPGASFDRVQVYYGTYGGSPQFPVNINGGSAIGTLAMDNGGEVYLNQSFAAAAGNNTVNVLSTAPYGYIAGVVTWTDSVKAIDIINTGWYDSQASDWADTSAPYSPANAIASLAGNLTIIMLGTNDRNEATEDYYKANMRKIIAKGKSVGDVLIIAPPYCNSAVEGGTQAQQSAYASYAVALAYETNSAFLNMQLRNKWTSFAAANTAGYMDADGVHFSAAGYADIAAAVKAVID